MASRKRLRANTAGESVPGYIQQQSAARTNANRVAPNHAPAIPEYDIRTALRSCDPNQLIEVLAKLSEGNPSITSWARTNYHRQVLKEQARVLDFDHHSKTIWWSINKEYTRLLGSRQYEKVGEVFESVEDSIASIQQNVTAKASFGTKASAIETLRKIAKTICLSGDVMGCEIRKMYQGYNSLTIAMIHVLECMSDEERDRMCLVNDGRGRFSQKMEEIASLASSIPTLAGSSVEEDGMDAVLKLLLGEDGEDDSDDENEDEDEEPESSQDDPMWRGMVGV